MPKSNLACVGIYMYSNKVFDAIEKIEPSSRGEYEITAVNNYFIDNQSCSYCELKQRWADAGTMDSYNAANSWAYNEK